MKDRFIGWFIDGILIFAALSLVNAVSGLGAEIIDDIRTIAGV